MFSDIYFTIFTASSLLGVLALIIKLSIEPPRKPLLDRPVLPLSQGNFCIQLFLYRTVLCIPRASRPVTHIVHSHFTQFKGSFCFVLVRAITPLSKAPAFTSSSSFAQLIQQIVADQRMLPCLTPDLKALPQLYE